MRFQGSELDVLQVEPDVGPGPTVPPLGAVLLPTVFCLDGALCANLWQK